jgi:mRNA interferase RelE/StbE
VAEYSVTFARPARKELERLNSPLVGRLVRKIEELSTEPRPFGCRKLAGEENLWRVRVGDYRIVYSIYDNERIVDIVRIRHRSEAYR